MQKGKIMADKKIFAGFNGKGDNTKFIKKDIFNITKTALPKYTKISSLNDIENFYLKFHKFAVYFDDKFHLYKHTPYKKGNKRKNIPDRPEVLETLDPNSSGIDFQKILNKLNKIKSSFQSQNYNVSDITFSPDWRLIVGLGDASVYETSITLHYIYGIPYIPASAIKGIVRNWIILSLFDKDEKKALQDENFCNIFGAPKESALKTEKKGNMIFLDAFPVSEPELDFDIMNPHYSEYYSHEKAPGDYYNPVPIHFITVKNTDFKFMIASKDKDLKIKDKNFTDLIKDAFLYNGIGAKTALGYGIGNIKIN